MTQQRQFSYLHPALFIICAACLWALDGVVRRSLFTLLPLVIVFYEHLIGSLLVLPAAWSSFFKEKMTTRTVMLVGIIAVWSGLLGTLFFTTALSKVQFIPFSVVFLIQKLQPLFATTAAVVLLKEKLTKKYLAWAGLALIAAYFTTFNWGVVNTATGSGTITAALYALGAAFCWGTATVFSKMLLNEHSTLFVTAARFITTTLCAAILLMLWGSFDAVYAVNSSQLIRFLFISVSTGMVAVYIYYTGLQKLEAKTVTILELFFPFLALVIDAIVYKTFLQPAQLLASAVLLYALYRSATINKR